MPDARDGIEQGDTRRHGSHAYCNNPELPGPRGADSGEELLSVQCRKMIAAVSTTARPNGWPVGKDLTYLVTAGVAIR